MKYCVVVANGSRARFFTLKRPQIPELESGPRLIEQAEISDPELKQHARDLWTEKPGKNRGKSQAQSHVYDDHRDSHQAEYERRFVQVVAERAARFAHEHEADNLVLCSIQRQLPLLRQALNGHLGDTRVTELAKDLSKLEPISLHDHLSKEGLIPPRKQ